MGLPGIRRRPERSVPHPPVGDDIVGELCSLMFASLPRKDQRLRGEQYVRGLLTAQGRKSVRNIAAQSGGGSVVQSLHHFVSSSTWDWLPMRAALASHVEQTAPPMVWVVQALAIPKSGEHSVGVGRRFVPQLGQVMRGQHALGVWFAAPQMSFPVNWRLLLPEQWTRDAELRRRAEVPESASAESVEDGAVAAVLETLRYGGVKRRPVVLDIPGTWANSVVLRHFARCGLPVVARTGPGTRLLVADPAMPGYGAGPLSAEKILMSVRGLRRAVEWEDPASGASRTSSAAMIRVTPADGTATATQRPLYLLGDWEDQWRPPAKLWLTDVAAPVGGLLRLTRVTHRVSRDLAVVGDRVGLRDFEGRSFRGWHRHTTLASVAHTASLLAGIADESASYTGRQGRLSA
ncbi:transposase [Streptomyces sp. NBC_01142]|uniref:IS701 family transposase n=1 Tax=Streptomyces sp. NBC_01142 TaxID=2975865 RepID=UPI002259AFCF|nr:transposase [Streptomyces sp. NBC_01142]MCX4824947.1 transposase [Streptomyces sp. NBC_01142]